MLPHTKRIDIVYLHMVHGYARNKIAVMFDHHYITVNKITKAYKQVGMSSLQFKTNCPVSRSALMQNEVEILDLKAIEAGEVVYTDEDIFKDLLNDKTLKEMPRG